MKVESRIVWNGDKAILAGHEIANKTNWEIAIYLSNDAKLLCPVNTGLTRASIMIRDKKTIMRGSGDFPQISAPAKDYDVHVGTAVPNAIYTEYGTGPHKTANKSEQFKVSITEWAKKHRIKNVQGLIRSIRLRGTKPHPFMRPAYDRATGRSVEVVREKVGKHFVFIMEKYLKK